MHERSLLRVTLAATATAVLIASAPALAQHHGGRSGLTNRADVTLPTKQPHAFPPPVPGGGPPNDNCANATPINSSPFTDSESTVGATDESGEPQSTCTLQGNSVWYTWTNGPNTALVSADTIPSDFDTAMMAWIGQCSNFPGFQPVACNDDGGGNLTSAFSFIADPNQTYLFQVGGFDGTTGNLTFDFSAQEFQCQALVIDGVLGQNSQGYPGTSGLQTGRLNRNGVASSCGTPKTCDQFDNTAGRAYDAYVIPNQSGADQCVTVTLHEDQAQTCNIQSNAYLGTYDPNNVCTDYLADPGLSTGVPPTDTAFGFVVPTGQDLTLVVHTINPGESGCPYTLTVLGDLCSPPPTFEIPVPTLDKMGLAALGVLLAGAALLVLRRKG